MANNLISQVKLGATTYDIKDAYARQQLEGLSGAMHFVGVSTTDPKGPSGATVEGHTTWAVGDVVLYGNKEYALKGSSNIAANWIELGDESSFVLKTFSHTYQPAGSVTGTFTGDAATITATVGYTPSGTISSPTFTGTTETLTHSVTTATPTGTQTANYTPSGSVGAPSVTAKTFTGTTATLTLTSATEYVSAVDDYQPAGTVGLENGFITAASGTVSVSTSGTAITAVDDHTYQPAGTVTVGTNTGSVSGTSQTITYSGEVLEFPSAAYLSALAGTTTFVTSLDTPSFTGTTATVTHSATKGSISSTGTFTPNVTADASKITFTGTTATLGVTKSTVSTTGSYQPAGSLSITLGAPSFTGSGTIISVGDHTYQPAGSISSPTFTGTSATLTATGSYTPAGTLTLTFTGTTATLTHTAE